MFNHFQFRSFQYAEPNLLEKEDSAMALSLTGRAIQRKLFNFPSQFPHCEFLCLSNLESCNGIKWDARGSVPGRQMLNDC